MHQNTQNAALADLSLTNIANGHFPTRKEELIDLVLTKASLKKIGVFATDIDHTAEHLTPGNHILAKPLNIAPAMTTMAQYFWSGFVTARPHKVIETGAPGLLSKQFGFAVTEAGARMVVGNQVVFEKAIPKIDEIKTRITDIINAGAVMPGAFIEEHTLCSLIVALTPVSAIHHDEAFRILQDMCNSLDTPETPVKAITGRKLTNTHFNFVPGNVDKGSGMRDAYSLFYAQAPMDNECINIICGDDKSDIDSFEYMTSAGPTIRIGVGPQPPTCDIHFEHPEELVELANEIALRLER